MPKVTVVIPILNVAAYLRECLDSVIHQTLQDIEIFCIDAGSTDGSLDIQKEYADKDSRIRLFEDDKRSTGYAKNLGFDKAESKYVAIVEPDDYIAFDMYEKLYRCAEENNADMVKGNYRSFRDIEGVILFADKAISLVAGDYQKVINPQSDNRYFGWDMYTWSGIYNKSFLDKYRIRHNESKGAAFQDVGFWFQTFCYAKRVYLLPDYFYHYRRDNPNSSVNNPNRTFVMCNEYDYLRQILIKDKPTWQRVMPAYYHELFRSYLVTYRRLADELKPDFAARFYDDLQEGLRLNALDEMLFEKDEQYFLKFLLQSSKVFEIKVKEHKENQLNKQQEIYQKLAQYKERVIFGAGSHGTNLQILFKQNNWTVDAFCDNSQYKQGMKLNGSPVLSPQDAVQKYANGLFIIANKRSPQQIYEQLLDLNVEENRILFCDVEDIVDQFL